MITISGQAHLTADQILKRQIGERVYLCDEKNFVECVIAGYPLRYGITPKKFLTYRDQRGKLKRIGIKDYPGKFYMLERKKDD